MNTSWLRSCLLVAATFLVYGCASIDRSGGGEPRQECGADCRVNVRINCQMGVACSISVPDEVHAALRPQLLHHAASNSKTPRDSATFAVRSSPAAARSSVTTLALPGAFRTASRSSGSRASIRGSSISGL